MKIEERVRISVDIGKKLKRRAQQKAFDESRSLTEVVVGLIKTWVNTKEGER